jgi:hypothetical protein
MTLTLPMHFLRIDEVGHPELLGECSSVGVEIDTDDHVGPGHPAALDNVEPDPAEAKDDDIGAGLDLCRVDHRTDASGHPAADIANLVEGRVLADLRHCNLWQHGEVREGRSPHIVVNFAAAQREPAGAVGHHPLALGRADRDTEIGLLRQTVFATPAFGRVKRDDVISFGDARYPAPDVDDDTSAFMTEDCGKEPLRIGPRQSELVGMADAGCFDLDQDLALLWAVELNRLDLERLSCFVSDSSASLHERLPTLDLKRTRIIRRMKRAETTVGDRNATPDCKYTYKYSSDIRYDLSGCRC